MKLLKSVSIQSKLRGALLFLITLPINYRGIGHYTTYTWSYSAPMKTLLLAALLLCSPVTMQLHALEPDVAYPVASGDIKSASAIGNVWDVTSKSGETHRGYVIPRPREDRPGLSYTVDETTGKTTTVIEGPGYRFISQ